LWQVISRARIPIVKFEHVASGLPFDVCFDQTSGPQGAALVRQLVADWPPLRPLVVVLKLFLQQRDLNEV
jgi:non-canonical poly(A) RNA polymerase PAPD5/7